MKRRTLLQGSLGAGIVGIAGCLDSFTGDGPVRVGVVEPLSGPVSGVGLPAQRGAELAEIVINENGGVLGRDLELIIEDGECEATPSVNAMQKLINEDQVVAIVGDTCTGVVQSMIPVSTQNQVPQVSAIASGPVLTEELHEWYFRVNPHQGMIAETYAEYMADNDDTFVISAIDQPFGRDSAPIYEELIPQFGGEVLDTFYYPPDQQDFTALNSRIGDADPSALIQITNSETGGLQVRQARDSGYGWQIYGVGVQATSEYLDVAGDAAEGIVTETGYLPDVETASNQDFVEAYRDEFDEDPVNYAAYEYLTVNLVASAIEAAESTERAAIRDAIEDIDYDSLLGPIQFDDVHQAHPEMLIITIGANNEITIEDRVQT